jgi:intein/homing endonuclease
MRMKEELPKLDYIIIDECLAPDTKIKTSTGLVEIQNIKINDLVLTYNEKKEIFEYKPVQKIHKNLTKSSNSKMLKIKTKAGKIIEITDNHKVLTSNGWKEAGDLSISEKILSFNIDD